MLNVVSRRKICCEGVTRRQLLQAGGAGLLGLSLPRVLAAEAAQPAENARAKSVIFLFLFGGPSQLESFDMKPDAPAEIRGPFKPIASRTPGLRICEHLAKTADVSDRFALIKTMSHPYNDHSGAGHYIQTGTKWHLPIGGGFNVTPEDWPSMGSVVNFVDQNGPEEYARDIPSYVVLPNFLGRLQDYRVQLRRPGETAGWLGRGYDPLNTAIDKRDAKDNPYFRDCTDEELAYQVEGLGAAGLTLDRLNRRRSLLDQFVAGKRAADESRIIESYDRFRRQAFNLATSEKTRQAFDITHEPASLRDRYGRHLFGQSTLMARRLIEAGVRFATVHYDCVDGYSWDSHRSSKYLENHLLPTLDQALSALLVDLEDRGLLDETLVVAMGEMGRTPKPNASWGRGHWSTLFPAVVAGAGVRGGVVYGETDEQAAYPVTKPVSPEDLAATIYTALGIDPGLRLLDSQNRPHPVVSGGRPLLEIFG